MTSTYRLLRAVVVTGAFAFATVGTASAGGGFSIRNGSVVNVGSVVSNNCFKLSSTVGEPAAGAISSGSLTLTSGFQATLAAAQQVVITDRIFQNGFDSQQGTCTP